MGYITLDKRLRIAKVLTRQLFLLILLAVTINFSNSFGFDSANSCSSSAKISRQGRAQILAAIPCDLTNQIYCNTPGSAYPWHAVRKFVHENQGLMKRMYGDVRHISILREEIQNNEIDIEDIEITTDRYTRDGFKRSSKLKHITELSKNNEVVVPHFRPVSSTATPQTTLTSRDPILPLQESTTENTPSTISAQFTDVRPSKKSNSTTPRPNASVKEGLAQNNNPLTSTSASSKCAPVAEYENLASNSVYEAPTPPHTNKLGDNIQIVESPRLDLSNTTTTYSLDTPLQFEKTTKKGEISPKRNESESSTAPYKDDDVAWSKKIDIINIDKSATAPSPSPTILLPSSALNADKLSTEKHEKATNSPEAGSATAKNVLREGQLYQDTLKQEIPAVVNMRGVNACPVKEEVVAPFWANNTRGEVLALLNLYPFEQYVHWEKCTHENKQMYCREGCRCEQQYRLHRLLAYDPHNECRGIFSDWFRFPSCCVCKCYDIPLDYRATSRSPRAEERLGRTHPFDAAEEGVKKAIYVHASEEWYRPKDDIDL